LILAVITGGALSWLASTHPDGLEWSIKKVTGKTETCRTDKRRCFSAQRYSGKKTAFFPDYNFKPSDKEKRGKRNARLAGN